MSAKDAFEVLAKGLGLYLIVSSIVSLAGSVMRGSTRPDSIVPSAIAFLAGVFLLGRGGGVARRLFSQG